MQSNSDFRVEEQFLIVPNFVHNEATLKSVIRPLTANNRGIFVMLWTVVTQQKKK